MANKESKSRYVISGDLKKVEKALSEIEVTVTYTVSCYGGGDDDPGTQVTETIVLDVPATDAIKHMIRSLVIKRQGALRKAAEVPGSDQAATYEAIAAYCAPGADGPSKVLASEVGHSPWAQPKGKVDPQVQVSRLVKSGKLSKAELLALLDQMEDEE